MEAVRCGRVAWAGGRWKRGGGLETDAGGFGSKRAAAISARLPAFALAHRSIALCGARRRAKLALLSDSPCGGPQIRPAAAPGGVGAARRGAVASHVVRLRICRAFRFQGDTPGGILKQFV